MAPLSDNMPQSQYLTLDQQIQMIDVEILLLKAELAQKNQQVSQVGVYLTELKTLLSAESLSPKMQARFARLQAYYDSAQQVLQPPSAGQFHFNPKKMLALLPMSGPYSQAGQAVYQGLQDAFHEMPMPYDLEVLDTNIYDSMFEAWEWVRLYQPSFIFGPLQKSHVAELKALDLHTPVLAFNEAEKLDVRDAMRVLSPSSSTDALASLMTYLQESHAQRIVLLSDGDKKSQALVKHFEALLEQTDVLLPIQVVNVTKIDSHVDAALEQALHAQQSQGRKGWLQHTIGHRLEFEERPRQDLDVVVSFLPYRLAMQVSPLLEYYHLNALAHYWLPSELPPVNQLVTSLPYWQSTSAILPSYYAALIQKKQSSKISDSGVGIFYALGQLAAKAVVNLTQENTHVTRSELGDLSVDSEQRFHIYPDVYWLDTGVFERLTP
ncbi:hypothetical protein [Thiomicrospira sp. XS5]|uniref:penicillin-binding protein activator n=1 Tax=Thiomicrospira sp. XS5 TaxID=1775636 RepID=UPI00083858A3|nr:hypothetical protein [Thiomicrospira sp. XS5]